MGCTGGTKTTPVEHSVILSATNCMLRDGQDETLDHSFTCKTTDFWTGKVDVKEIPASQGVSFNGNKNDTFPVNPVPATDYLLGIYLRKAKNPATVKRPVKFRMSDRTALGNGAAVEVTTFWTLGKRHESGSFSLSFMVGP